MTERNSVLEARDVTVTYGNSLAVDGVSLTVEASSATAVLGANGAGKSSFARALCGLVPPASGSIIFDGKDVSSEAPHRIRRLGLAYLPEGRGVFPSLSVQDNVRMAVRWMADKNARSEALERGLTMFPALVNARSQRAGTLSGGEQQMLALACELATQPRVLVADELSLGLAPKIVDAVFDTLRHALKSGTSIILIEQFVDRALGLAENVIVLGGGLVVWQGPSDAVDTDELVRRYMGEVPLQLPE